MTDRNIIGQKIAELRKNKGMTQAELADRLGVSHQAVSQWERSETLPDILTLPLIAEIFDENIAVLLGIEEVKKEQEEPETPEHIHVDIERMMDEGEKNKKAAAKVNNLGTGDVIIKGKVNKSQNQYQIDANDFSLPVSEDTINLSKDSDYEVAVMQNGKIIKKFNGNPDNFLRVILVGECNELHSSMSVEVQGDVKGNARSGFGMTIGGDVDGDATSGFEMRCGNVGGNAKAGFDLHCGTVGGDASAGFTFKKNKKNGKNEDKAEAENSENISGEGKTITINGDYNGDLSTAAVVTICGNVEGNVDCSKLTVEGNIEGDVTASSSVSAGGDINGDVDAGNSAAAGGDINGDVDAGNSATAGGDINGDVDAGRDAAAGGDINGDVDAGGDVTAGGDINGDIDADGDVRVEGDVTGDISGNKITIEGDHCED